MVAESSSHTMARAGVPESWTTVLGFLNLKEPSVFDQHHRLRRLAFGQLFGPFFKDSLDRDSRRMSS